MKISRLKLLSVLCFIGCFVIVFCFYYHEYKASSKDIVVIERIVDADGDKTFSGSEYVTSDDDKKVNDDTMDEEEANETIEDVVEEAEEVVYDGLTLDELAAKLDRTLSSNLSSYGYLYASYCLEKGVDPYLAVAITMEETGCAWGCSNLVVSCNNVGGMKGSGCGAYGYFSTLDDGVRAFIDNIYNNYVAYGLTTAETMNPKYAENPMWASNVNAYIEKIKNR